MFVCLALHGYYAGYLTPPPLNIGVGLTAFFILLIRAPPIQAPFFVQIGKISYSIYLLHFPIILWCFQDWGHWGNVHLLATIVLILVLSHVMYVLVERPCMDFARRFQPKVASTPV
jgi:peptidoglycan/LPS O-acetylase OafA/YrhL